MATGFVVDVTLGSKIAIVNKNQVPNTIMLQFPGMRTEYIQRENLFKEGIFLHPFDGLHLLFASIIQKNTFMGQE